MWVKADMHIHTREDPCDHYIKYSAKQLVNLAHKKGFKVLSITLHNEVFYSKNLFDYADSKGILLIKGAELTLEGKHVLVYGLSNLDIKSIRNFQDLRDLRRKKSFLVVAPHPFYPNIFGNSCLQDKFFDNLDLFDALEIQQLHTRFYNPNKRAFFEAKRFKLGLLANSDSHFRSSFGKHYSLLDVKKLDEKSVFDAIIKNKVNIVSKPMSVFRAFFYLVKHYFKK